MTKGAWIELLEEEQVRFAEASLAEYPNCDCPPWHFRYLEVIAGMSQCIIRSITDRF